MSANEGKKTKNLRLNISVILIKFGLFLVTVGVFLGIIFFYPAIIEEVNYLIHRPNENAVITTNKEVSSGKSAEIVPIDADFGIIIPKIGANSKVVPNVDPYDSKAYQMALTQGVAHSAGTVYPGQVGNTFLFSHSSVNFYEASRYNSVFYLLNKLDPGDDFYLFYNGEPFKYRVTEAKIVNAEDTEYMKSSLDSSVTAKTATLMTCWPAGTTFKRLVVIGDLVE